MFAIPFVNFLGNLDVQYPNYEIPSESPIFLSYNEKENLSKHEILRRFKKVLEQNNISFLRPFKSLSSEWLIDLQELKYSNSCFNNTKYLKGVTTVEPQYLQNKKFDDLTEEVISTETLIRFSIYPEDILLNTSSVHNLFNEELKEPLDRFRKDFPDLSKCGFLMMKFEDSVIQTNLVSILKEIFASNNLILLRADDKWYADDLFLNVKTYMHACTFGVALFERINSNYFNPNVSLEIGYMMAMGKPILYLKDKTLTSLHSDLISKLYYEYDFQQPRETLEPVTIKWLNNKGII